MKSEIFARKQTILDLQEELQNMDWDKDSILKEHQQLEKQKAELIKSCSERAMEIKVLKAKLGVVEDDVEDLMANYIPQSMTAGDTPGETATAEVAAAAPEAALAVEEAASTETTAVEQPPAP